MPRENLRYPTEAFDSLLMQIKKAQTLNGKAQTAALQTASNLAHVVMLSIKTESQRQALLKRIGVLFRTEQGTAKLILQSFNKVVGKKKR